MLVFIHIKKNYPPIQSKIEVKTYVEEYEEKDFFEPDSILKGYLGKRKPDGKGWSEKYGKYLKEMSNLI